MWTFRVVLWKKCKFRELWGGMWMELFCNVFVNFRICSKNSLLTPNRNDSTSMGGGCKRDCVYRWITIQIQLSFSSQFIFPISSAVSSRVVKSTPTPALLTVRFFIWYQRGSSIWKNLKFEIFAWISHIFLKLQQFKHC